MYPKDSMKIIKKTILPFILLLIFTVAGKAQLDVNFEFQAYPTGLIPSLRVEKTFGEKNAAHLRLGYQLINHRDLGVHESEEGSGYGFSIGYKRYFNEGFDGLALGIKNDVWFNTLDWKDNIDAADEISGTSEITVIQPTAELSYLIPVGDSWTLTPAVAFGMEVNVQTEGEPVGEGAILLVGVSFGKRF